MKYKKLFVITGNCLFPDHLLCMEETVFFMAEDRDLCSHYRYHKHKIILILSAMRSHYDELSGTNKTEYFRIDGRYSDLSYEDKLLITLKKYGIKEITIYDMEDLFFRERIENFCTENRLKLTVIDSPGFLTTHADFLEYMDSYNRIFLNDFYIWQRKRLGILLNKNAGPCGDKWNFDKENRKKLPGNIKIPELPKVMRTRNTVDVSKLVEDEFSDHPGISENFYLPTTREQSQIWMTDFFENRFFNFGPYQDAISGEHTFIFHSVLSPIINIGLLKPGEVLSTALQYRDTVPLQSIEGFIRQLIGWREFVRGVYNNFELKKNFFCNDNRMNSSWYDGTTGLPPLDNTIKKVITYAYAHHIERLMILSNIMLLCEIHPDDVNRWFTELFVDSSDWVMVPNVYGMGQFADGGTFATKPYISGSNYILKMSNIKKGEWCEIWDGLYWRFIDRNREFFQSNYRMSLMTGMLDRMDDKRKSRIFRKADDFIRHVTL